MNPVFILVLHLRKIYFNISFPSKPGVRSDPIHLGFQTQILSVSQLCYGQATDKRTDAFPAYLGNLITCRAVLVVFMLPPVRENTRGDGKPQLGG
jgi:hypothetical protein